MSDSALGEFVVSVRPDDRTVGRSVAFAADALARMGTLAQSDAAAPLPAQAGRSIRPAAEAARAASPGG